MKRIIITFSLLILLPVAAGAQAPVTVEYYHLDAVGSVRVVTDKNGAEVKSHSYRPFGEGDGTAGATDLLRFTSKERDAETGLDYFGARHYRAWVARFTTVDPVLDTAAALNDPQRWNRYGYSKNNPIRYIDPNGEQILVLSRYSEQDLARNASIRATVYAILSGSSDAIPLAGLMPFVTDAILSTVLPTDRQEELEAMNSAVMGMVSPFQGGRALNRLKPMNLPAWRRVAIDMEEILSGHTSRGARAVQSGVKDVFPDSMSPESIVRAVRHAYRYGRKVTTQGNRVLIRGPFNDGVVLMWFNKTTKTIETAWPK